MNDMELLELAAKAAGIGPIVGFDDHLTAIIGPLKWKRQWAPLADDGDALRLAVRVGVCVVIADGVVVAQRFYADSQSLHSWSEKLVRGDTTPVRRAIVRAAAEIGRSMP